MFLGQEMEMSGAKDEVTDERIERLDAMPVAMLYRFIVFLKQTIYGRLNSWGDPT